MSRNTGSSIADKRAMVVMRRSRGRWVETTVRPPADLPDAAASRARVLDRGCLQGGRVDLSDDPRNDSFPIGSSQRDRERAGTRFPGCFGSLALALPIAAADRGGAGDPRVDSRAAAAVRRGLTEALLRAVLVVYSVVFLAAVVGTPLSAGCWRGRGGAGKVRPGIARRFLVCLSCLVVAGRARARLGGLAGLDAPVSRAADDVSTPSPPEEYRIVVLGARVRWESRTGPGCRWARSSPGSSSRRSRAGGSSARSWRGWAIRWRCSITSWPALKRRPDAVIIYSGHNEFAARFEEERDGWLDEEPGTWLLQASRIAPA